MRKKFNPYWLLLLVLFILLVLAEFNAPKPVDWRRTYSQRDKIPFGCNAMYRLLSEDMFRGRMEKQDETPFNVLIRKYEGKTAYVFVNSNISFSRLDAKYLMDFAAEGNDVFMAAGSFYDNKLADTFRLTTNRYFVPLGNYFDSTRAYAVNFCSPSIKKSQAFRYKMGFESARFETFDTAHVRVLAMGNDTDVVFLRAPFGKGNFYFLSLPDVFSNYFVVNDSARHFAYGALSYLGDDKLWWDEYFKGSHVRSGGPLQFIFANDSLYAGYLLTFISLIIFMIFAMKRRQRAIAIVEPLPNTTLQFVEVVGSVYYNTRNHKIIAEEKINSFYEFLRGKFLVNSRRADEETLQRIAKLSGVPLADVKKLFLHIGMVWRQGSITEKELVDLNKSIEHFYKHNKR
jgi:hypothetical protein